MNATAKTDGEAEAPDAQASGDCRQNLQTFRMPPA